MYRAVISLQDAILSGEVSEYVKETIPEEVKSEAVPPVRSDEAPSPVL